MECKASTTPTPKRGYYTSIQDFKPQQACILTPNTGPSYPLDKTITLTGIQELISVQNESLL